MKRPVVFLAGIPLLLWALFVMPDVSANAHSLWDWRWGLILLSGSLALWWMSAGMVLAARLPPIERALGGLDRLYRLHKQVGIGTGLIVLTHWMLEWLPKNLAKAGLIARPGRGGRPPGSGEPDPWIELAKEVGEWAGYVLLALVVIALVRRIPYRYFRWVHKLFPLVFIAGAYHGLMLMPTIYWQGPLGWLTAFVVTLGVVPAVQSLRRRIGARQRVAARIESVVSYPDGVLEVVCRPTGVWPGHRTGQHTLVDFGRAGEGAHPITIASAWNPPDGCLTLAIKALGDFTGSLQGRLAVGQPVVLEGPYGGFTFDAPAGGGQVWIAGGIGITPFIARLRELAAHGGCREPVDFFYSTEAKVPHAYPADLPALCAAAGVTLHRHYTAQDGLLAESSIRACLKSGASVWFCGPAAWGDYLVQRFCGEGCLPSTAFHREFFEFR